MVPEPVRPHIDPALPATASDDLVDAAGSHRAAVADPEPQLPPEGLGVPGPDTQVPVQAPRGLVTDLDHPGLTALPQTLISRCHRSTSLRRRSSGSYRRPASSDSRIPVAVNTADHRFGAPLLDKERSVHPHLGIADRADRPPWDRWIPGRPLAAGGVPSGSYMRHLAQPGRLAQPRRNALDGDHASDKQ
jgi:hypothetical protein